ncbi:MAG: DEAD/DEAH box helicase [Kiritimatiellae bacterium]|nr:DEAD/DEAH box helicase [Kiritimatiellia bacterium]MDD3545865.1 DEAD/DEAH box helicase [Kiritimatiellia bacterium]
MIILHTIWRGGAFLFWGEREASPADFPSDSGGVKISPYDPGAAKLASALGCLLCEDGRNISCAEEELLLPSAAVPWGEVPVPSRAFLADRLHAPSIISFADGASYPLRPWRVTAAHLSWRQTLPMLGACQERRLADNLFAGEDLLACAAIFRYTGALVARGKFLPGLRSDPAGQSLAVWEPALDGEERRRFNSLADRMPTVVAADAPRQAARAMLAALTDSLVRFSLVTTLSRAYAEHGCFYSAHDAWFAALRGDSPVIRWEADGELDELRDALDQWRRPVEGGAGAQAALLFQLDEPDAPNQPWPIKIMLTAANGVVPFPCSRADAPPSVAAVWEDVLITLGQAALLFPPLGCAAPQDGYFGCPLAAAEAHAFLSVHADLLEAAGYAVVRPDWWGSAPPGAVTLEAGLLEQQKVASEFDLNAKVGLTWNVLFNGETVTRAELELLLAAESPLVFFRGRWLLIDTRRLQEALRLLKRRQVENVTALQVVRMTLGLDSGGHGLEVTGCKGASWLDALIGRLDGSRPFGLLPPPSGFCGELRPYQLRGFSWLVFLRRLGLGACLADDMGLGKTVQALALLLHEKAAGQSRPALLVGPMSILGNWLREARRFAPGLRCRLHHGADRPRGADFGASLKNMDLVITSYTLLYRDYADFRRVAWSGVILDEAQNIKNPGTRQAQAARALQASYRIALTGTPMENHVGELWSVMDFLNPGLLGSRGDFRERFWRPIQAGADLAARSRLRRATAPFILRRLKTDRQIIADLPEKTENRVYCPLTREQAQLYQETLESFQNGLVGLEGLERRGSILAVLTRLKQICNHPANYFDDGRPLAARSGKLLRLEEMIEESFAGGESVLIFTQYAKMGHLLRRRLCQAFAMEMPFLHGSLSLKERDNIVRGFQESVEPQAFILSLKAGGTGLNLTRASRVFHYDRWWNPAVENQATDRAFRIGQTRDVMVHKFICGGTLEDRIDAMIERKTALAGEIVNSGETFLTELSNEELADVLKLSVDEGFL